MNNDRAQAPKNLVSLMRKKREQQQPEPQKREDDMPLPARSVEVERSHERRSIVPKFKTRPKDEFERHTFYALPDAIKELKYWSLIDDRGQSEILREALDMWLERRRREEG